MNRADVIPESHLDLLTRPLFGHFATIRPDGAAQVNPMWFLWDGENLKLTNTTTRRKYRNVSVNPRVALSVIDPTQRTAIWRCGGVSSGSIPTPRARSSRCWPIGTGWPWTAR